MANPRIHKYNNLLSPCKAIVFNINTIQRRSMPTKSESLGTKREDEINGHSMQKTAEDSTLKENTVVPKEENLITCTGGLKKKKEKDFKN